MKQTAPDWLQLDNAGKLYPTIESNKHPSIFHLSATIQKPVDPEVLRRAASIVSPRFPYFNVQLERGFFWYYFAPHTEYHTPKEARPYPCESLSKLHDGKKLYRISYEDRRISVEFFHAITDASGALAFLKSLLTAYARTLGYSIPKTASIIEPDSKIDDGEYEDAFSQNYVQQRQQPDSLHKTLHITGLLEPANTLHVITGSLRTSAIKQICKPFGVSITEYLSAVYLFALYNIQKKHKLRSHPIRLSIPVNLRNLYKTKSLRNFSLFIRPEIDPTLGTYTFEEILMHVHHSIRYDLQKNTSPLSLVQTSILKDIL